MSNEAARLFLLCGMGVVLLLIIGFDSLLHAFERYRQRCTV